MYQMVMTNFEAREQELIQENQSLKDFLLTMYGHLNENLHESGVSGEDALVRIIKFREPKTQWQRVDSHGTTLSIAF